MLDRVMYIYIIHLGTGTVSVWYLYCYYAVFVTFSDIESNVLKEDSRA